MMHPAVLIYWPRVCHCAPLAGEEAHIIEKQTTARFFRKPTHVTDLQDDTAIIQPAPFQIVREVILPEAQYRRFRANLLANTPFITTRTDLTGYDENTGFRCLLVTSRKRRDGILVDSEGYGYARYAAYVRDKRALDLQGVVRDNLDLKERER